MLRTQTYQEKERAKRIMRRAGIPAAALLGILLLIGLPSDLWTPDGAGEFLRNFICAILFGAVGIFLVGANVLIEDWEVRTHRGSGPIFNPISGSGPFFGCMGIVACIVYIIRYVYLLFFH